MSILLFFYFILNLTVTLGANPLYLAVKDVRDLEKKVNDTSPLLLERTSKSIEYLSSDNPKLETSTSVSVSLKLNVNSSVVTVLFGAKKLFITSDDKSLQEILFFV